MKYDLKPRAAALVLSALLLTALPGCGGQESVQEPPTRAPAAPTQPVTEPATQPATQPATEPVPADPVIRVSSPRELLESIAPDARIVIEPGYYDLSDYLEVVWAEEGESWNEAHPYVQLRECFDGVEPVVCNVTGLEISGGGGDRAATELVLRPRYATVLSFEECGEVGLSNLTLGHTDTGDCAGNVLNFYGCAQVTLENVDLYGCGVYGIGCYQGTGEVSVTDSLIRDCSMGPLEIYDGAGRFEFRRCALLGSEGYAWYEAAEQSELAFYECEFGETETSYFMFHEQVYTEDCRWSDTYLYPDVEYPDVEPEGPVFDPDTMQWVSVLPEELAGSSWEGYAAVNPESGETVALPFEDEDGFRLAVALELWPDGIGQMDDGSQRDLITWGGTQDGSLWLGPAIGGTYSMTPYVMGGEDRIWLLLDMGEIMVWLY